MKLSEYAKSKGISYIYLGFGDSLSGVVIKVTFNTRELRTGFILLC